MNYNTDKKCFTDIIGMELKSTQRNDRYMNKPGPYGPGCSEKVVSMLKAVFNDTDKNGGITITVSDCRSKLWEISINLLIRLRGKPFLPHHF